MSADAGIIWLESSPEALRLLDLAEEIEIDLAARDAQEAHAA